MKKLYIFSILFLPFLPSDKDETWVQKANFGGAGRSSPFYFSIGEKGYVGGGDLSQTSFSGAKLANDFWEYAPAKDKWTQKANIPKANSGGLAFATGGKGYVAVTFVGNSSYSQSTCEFLEYDPIKNKWTSKANFPKGDGATAFAIGGKGYVVSLAGLFSKKEDGSVWEYEPSSDSWSKKSGADVKDIRRCFIIDNTAYFIATNKKIIYAYNPVDGSWTEKTKCKGTLGEGNFSFTYNGKGYFGGGELNDGSTTGDFYEYDPIKNEVTEKEKMFKGTKYAIALTIGNRVFGGLGARPFAGKSKDWYEYNPE